MEAIDLIHCGAIYFSNIETGFENYKHHMIEGSKSELYDYVYNLVEENGYENSYVDFYYNRIDEEGRRKVDSCLTECELDYIKNHIGESIYYKLDQTLLDITLKLSIEEMLFSTFYFCKTPCTVWGNYGLKWPVFYKK